MPLPLGIWDNSKFINKSTFFKSGYVLVYKLLEELSKYKVIDVSVWIKVGFIDKVASCPQSIICSTGFWIDKGSKGYKLFLAYLGF